MKKKIEKKKSKTEQIHSYSFDYLIRSPEQVQNRPQNMN